MPDRLFTPFVALRLPKMGKAAAWIRKKTKKLPSGPLWERGYFVSTVGVSEMAVRNYVQNQHTHHAEATRMSLIDRVIGSRRA
ncbi:transposase [Candidatus Uhrbacteria bacterium]|nr:transposase [Candidatus Uhrbacteria bacterium]